MIDKATPLPYPYGEHKCDAVYIIDMKKCQELEVDFFQTRSLAVLHYGPVPPECLKKIEKMDRSPIWTPDKQHLEAPPPDETEQPDWGDKIEEEPDAGGGPRCSSFS